MLTDEFLAEVRGMPHSKVAVKLPQKLLKGEVSTRRRKNVVQARPFAEILSSPTVDGAGPRSNSRSRTNCTTEVLDFVQLGGR